MRGPFGRGRLGRMHPVRPSQWFSVGAATGAFYTLSTIAVEGCWGETQGMCGLVFVVLNYPTAATVNLAMQLTSAPAWPGLMYAGVGLLNACVFGAAAVLYSRWKRSVPLFMFLAFVFAFTCYAFIPWLMLRS